MSVTTDQQAYPQQAAAPPNRTARIRQRVRARGDDPRWARPGLFVLLAGTALLYAWGVGRSGWANSFYSAAVQAGSHSWKAFFFGSSDAANFITVDKPPASLWVMDISARLFGVNAWSILLPQAAEGVAAVAVLYAAVRRWFGPAAGLAAGAVLALTPVAVLMFRFNNPDALLTLLLVVAAYCLVRAIEAGSTRWLLLVGVAVGFAFLAKMLQALVVVPGFGLAYLVTAPTPLRRRIGQLLTAGAALVVSAGWWVAIVALWPAASRPYVGGSQSNSILELIFGYNGFGRLTGNETGSVTGGRGGFGGGGMWGPTGWTRLFADQMGGQVSWLIPAALIFTVALLWLGRRLPRTEPTRAAVLIWAGWLVVAGLVLSFAQGIIHPYYTVALAPAIGALIGIGVVQLWRVRHMVLARLALAAALATTALWSAALLDRTPQWHPWLRELVLVGGLAGALLLLLLDRLARGAAMITMAVAALVGLAGPAAYAQVTAATPHSGAIPSAGPAGAGFGFGFGRGAGGLRRGAFPNGGFPGGGLLGGNNVGPGGTGGFPGGGLLGGNNVGPGGTGGFPGGGFPRGGRGGRGGPGGLLDGTTPGTAVVAALKANAASYTWVAAAIGSNSAAGYQLATGEPVMSVGGFNGSDPAPSLQQFQQYVAAGKIHYFIGGGGFGRANGGSDSSGEIAQWVQQNFQASTVGGTTLYDLTAPTDTTAS